MATNQQRIQTIISAVQSHLPYTFGDGTVTVTVLSVSAQQPNPSGAMVLEVYCTATGPNGDIPLDLPFHYVNPPTGVRQPDNTVRSTAADKLQAAQQMILDTVYHCAAQAGYGF